ncbi:uncharacterized protein MYCFIDRAFT_171519 [Pseudocercospora fijiensis CIRAD86]|uniref:Uncharacterized protein n=1 Tax=Pseudocercospora fijiensis (strain CIRAD86) TaxID=383855 RepID=M3A3G2_PSEFD|nr:uncharacterized protein MYCFIDRAFT_171519 [Pseudocercospora fijiensis CIRAD86]EME85629.1 hypothetical protein MYCFIDRAFT_171519 [Pseudocercospora fijiensis CIRAD86]
MRRWSAHALEMPNGIAGDARSLTTALSLRHVVRSNSDTIQRHSHRLMLELSKTRTLDRISCSNSRERGFGRLSLEAGLYHLASNQGTRPMSNSAVHTAEAVVRTLQTTTFLHGVVTIQARSHCRRFLMTRPTAIPCLLIFTPLRLNTSWRIQILNLKPWDSANFSTYRMPFRPHCCCTQLTIYV